MSHVLSIRLVFRWLPGRGVLIWDPDEPFADADLLKRCAHLVLAHHPDTFYGTDVALVTDTDEDPSGILLTPLQAVTFFAQLEPNRMVHWDWPDDLPVWREAAQRMADAFASNRLAPALDGARPGRPAWRLFLEDGTDALAGLPDWVREWANLAVWELVAADADLDRAWQGVLDAHPVLAEDPGRGLWLDEAQWHEAIGWRPDPCPFTAGLRLCEPVMGLERGASWDDAADGPTGWRLQVVLRDKVQPDLVYGLWPDVAREGRLAPRTGPEGRAARGTPETGVALDPDLPPAPPDWLAYEERLRQSVGHWLAAVPWLAAPAGWLPRGSLSEADAWRFLTEAIPPLRAAGCLVMVPAWWERAIEHRPRLRARVRPASGVHGMFGIDQTVEFDWRVALGGEEMDPEAFERLVAQKRRLIWFHGQWRVVDPAWAQRLLTTMKRRGEALTLADVLERALLGGDAGAGADGDPAGADCADGATGDGATEEGAEPGGDGAIAADPGATGTAEAPFEVALNEPLRALIGGLRDIRQMPVLPTPPGFRGELRAYQRIGFSWFAFLRRFGLGACLADDMGLGKTVQFIAYLLHVRSEGAALGPALIVCPTSVVGNWQKELERFAPGLRVYVHYGSGRAKAEAFADACREADVVVTSYTLAYLDGDLLQGVVWDTVCLDEAQNIKNPHTKQAQAVRHLQARHRVAMTGTPVENRLTELWSLFAFLNPGYLGSERAFQSRFAAPIEKSGDAARTRVLQRLVRPFLLRRMKTDPGVAADLPEKAEAKVYVPLTKEQAALYEGVLQDMLARLADVDGMERRGLVLATLTKLKQICNHPLAFLKADPAGPGGRGGLAVGGSGGAAPGGRAGRLRGRSEKLERLLEMVEEVRASGERCLVFTQFVETGELLRRALEDALDEPVLFLHGGVRPRDRDRMVETFQDPASRAGVFLLSLRAGGVGLNLTAATHVFHFDRWWNPAVENQATDRAYRIGQHRHVQVHKFITLGTLEERIDQLIERKLALGEQIIGTGEQWITELSTDELRDLFALRRSWVTE